jgi:uncharacterized protein (TIGR02147 family)
VFSKENENALLLLTECVNNSTTLLVKATQIFEYTDYRSYLRDFFEEKKATNPSFSFATFARRAGLASRATAKLVLDGKRNLGLETVPKFCKGLGLAGRESRYFTALVQFAHARGAAEKNDLYRSILAFPERRRTWSLGEAQHRFYSNWFYAAIQEMVLMKGFPAEPAARPEWIHRRLGGRITVRQAERALTDLVALGMLRPEPSGGLAQANPHYESSDGKLDFVLQDFHRRMIEEALAAIDRPLEQRNLAGVTLAIRKADLPAALDAIREFRRKFNFDFSADRDADEVWELNLQFFRLAQADAAAPRSKESPHPFPLPATDKESP